MKKALQFFLGMFIVQSAISQSAAGLEWKTELSTDHSVSYPKNWRFDNSGDMGALFTIYSPFTDEDDHYNDYVQLNMLPVTGLNMTLDKHIESTLKDVPFFYQKSEVTINRKDIKGGKACAVLAYHGLFNDFELSHYQYIWILNEKVFTLSFTGQPSGVELLLPEAMKIMDSFSFK
jgi:hypothetical protein